MLGANGEPIEDVVAVAGVPQCLDFQVRGDIVEPGRVERNFPHAGQIPGRRRSRRRSAARRERPSPAPRIRCRSAARAGRARAADCRHRGDSSRGIRHALVPFHHAVQQAHPVLVGYATCDPGAV